jgi:hypothetical protein
MSWNYRVCKEQEYYTIRECFYDKKGKLNGWTSEASSPGGETIKELKADLILIQKAISKPVVNLDKKP